MGKGKDGSECYTRFNKSGGKYVVCEGVQEARKKKREANKSKPPPKKSTPKKATPKKATPKQSKPSVKKTKTFNVKDDFDEMAKILAKDSKTDRWGFGRHINKYMKSKSKIKDINRLKEHVIEKYKNNKYVYDNVIFVNDDYRPSYVYKGKIYDKLSLIS